MTAPLSPPARQERGHGLVSGHSRPRSAPSDDLVGRSAIQLRAMIEEFAPTHVVSMVSGGKDSAASHAVLLECGIQPDLIIHGNTRTGIPETSRFVEEQYGNGRLGGGADFAVADAGGAYESYVLRKGFFGVGIGAHAFAYRVLKAQPFRATIAKWIRKRRRNIRVLLINGARKDESANRQKHLKRWRADPQQTKNVWFNLIHDWSLNDRDEYLAARSVPINPVAKALCRSGECMCGTMQSRAERHEAAAIYPDWGRWLKDLEAEVRRLHGFGWGETFPRKRAAPQHDLFQPMCTDCTKGAA